MIKNEKIRGGWICIYLLFIVSSCNESSSPIKCTDLEEIQIFAKEIRWDKKLEVLITSNHCGEIDSLDAKLKFRGGTSSKYDKHSYAITFSKKRSFSGIDSSKHWILNASYIDKSFMRHKLCFDLYRAMNNSNCAPQCSYVKVKENNVEKGLYIMMQRMDKESLKIKSSDSLAFIFKEPPLFYPIGDVPNRDSAYLATQEFPKIHKGDFSHQLKRLERLIFLDDDVMFKKDIFKILDINNIIDWHLTLLLTNNTDGQLKNYFIYRTDTQSKIKIALWDYDHSFGRDGDNEYNLCERNVDDRRLILFQRIMDLNPQNYNERLVKRWKELRKTVFTDKFLNDLVNQNDSVLRPFIKENEKIWPVNGTFYFDDATYFDELKLIKQYISMRLQQLDKRFGV